MHIDYKSSRSWVTLQTRLIEELSETLPEADVELLFEEGRGAMAIVKKRDGDLGSKALYIYSGPKVGEHWDTLVLVDVKSTIGRYTDMEVAVKVTKTWATGKLRRSKP